MAFDNYVLPDDRDPQGTIIAEVEKVNDQKINPQNYRAGICFMLSTNWALRCTQDSATAPNLIWRAMRRESIYYFKQIAQQQVGMKSFWAGDFYKGASDAVELGSRSVHHVKKLVPTDETTGDLTALAALIKAGLVSSTSAPKLVLIYFKCGPTNSHCIAAARPEGTQGKIYLYDPNIGVAIIDESQGHSLASVLTEMNTYFNYQIGKCQVVPLT